MSNFFGYNTLRIDDKAAYIAHIRKLQPKALLFYADQLDFARQVKAEFPDMVVIIRNWPDDNLYSKLSPVSWLSQHEGQAAGELYLYTCNESGLTAENIQWHMQLMDLCVQKGIHLVMLNPATGTWDTPDFERLKPLLIKASQHRDLFIIGLHSYAGGVITSGIAGGIPTHAGVDPNGANKDKGRNLIPVANWPSPVRDTTFHLGRHSWLIRYCYEQLGMAHENMPRFALTETGFDYLGDIGAWLNTLDHSGFSSVNGWQTLRSQWVTWWGKQSADSWYVTQFEYARDNLLNGLEFALFFAYGDDGNWHNYDVSKSGIPALLEQLSAPPVTPPAPQFPVFPSDFDERSITGDFLITASPSLNVRSLPTQNSALVGSLPQGTAKDVEYISADRLKPSERYENDFGGLSGVWIPVRFMDAKSRVVEGWTFNGYMALVPKPEPPPVPTLHTVTIRIPGLTLEQAQALIHNVTVQIEEET